jgi:hypothetical protein
MNIIEKVKSYCEDPYNRHNIYYNKKTHQIAYSKIMESSDDGFRKGMYGAFDLETNKVICRNFDNIYLSLSKRGFESITFDDFMTHYVPVDRDNKLSELVGQPTVKLHKDVLDMSEEQKKWNEYTNQVRTAIQSSKSLPKDLTSLIEVIHSLSRKGISVEQIKSMI